MEREQLNFYLQHAPYEELQGVKKQVEDEAHIELIGKPVSQTLLVPVKDPINQGSFISGEVLVSSAVVLVNETNGWAMVMDENHDLAVAVALLDGAFTAGVRCEEIIRLARMGEEQLTSQKSHMNARVNATRVSFDLL